MTLMPVTRIAISVDWSTKSGASAWIGAVSVAPIGPRSSIGSPITFMIRPSVIGPTGTRICEPVSRHLLAAGQAVGRVHRDRADGVLAEMLRDFEHEAVAVIVGLERREDRRQLAVERHVDDGADDLARSRPVLVVRGGGCHEYLPCLLSFGVHELWIVSGAGSSTKLERFRARDDLDELGGDRGLAGAVVLDRQPVDHVARVARRIVHRGHPAALLGRGIFQQRAEDLDRDVARQQLGEDFLLVGLIFDRGEAAVAAVPASGIGTGMIC